MMKNDLIIYDTLTNQKQRFEPMHPNQVNLYVCGITAYDYCHIGHARVMIFFDVVYRYLTALGFKVNYVRNITDIDDKIINRALENNEPCEALTTRFIEAMHEDAATLNVLLPTQEPKATDYIAEIVRMVEQLIAAGVAYVAEDGDVCYEVSCFTGYGKLSNQDLEKLRVGSRVLVAEAKRDSLDFVLWKRAKPGEPSWASPWGAGRPGWHIECSAMSTSCLSAHFDIHGGGLDLVFPHHENEIAQSEAATGQTFVNTWMHVGFVQINKEKMSKSLQNFFTIREVLARYKGEVIRYFMLSSHYRSPINYADGHLDQAQTALLRCYTALDGVVAASHIRDEFALPWRTQFFAKMNDDFNTPEALAVIFDLVHELNRAKEDGKSEQASMLAALMLEFGHSLGLFFADPAAFRNNLAGQSADFIEAVEQLIQARKDARQNKDWQKADEIRAQLDELQVIIEDSKDGTQWRKR
jgi:cysteinyl-tRNA synthetase